MCVKPRRDDPARLAYARFFTAILSRKTCFASRCVTGIAVAATQRVWDLVETLTGGQHTVTANPRCRVGLQPARLPGLSARALSSHQVQTNQQYYSCAQTLCDSDVTNVLLKSAIVTLR